MKSTKIKECVYNKALAFISEIFLKFLKANRVSVSHPSLSLDRVFSIHLLVYGTAKAHWDV